MNYKVGFKFLSLTGFIGCLIRLCRRSRQPLLNPVHPVNPVKKRKKPLPCPMLFSIKKLNEMNDQITVFYEEHVVGEFQTDLWVASQVIVEL